MTLKQALRLIAYSKPDKLLVWALENVDDPKILADLQGYQPRWRQTAEYRGAIVYVHRLIARIALRENKRRDR